MFSFPDIPDFSRYQQLTTLPAEGFPTGRILPLKLSLDNTFERLAVDDRKSRVILIGDVHGMDKPLQSVTTLRDKGSH